MTRLFKSKAFLRDCFCAAIYGKFDCDEVACVFVVCVYLQSVALAAHIPVALTLTFSLDLKLTNYIH